MPRLFLQCFAILLLLSASIAPSAFAAAPSHMLVEGVLTSAGGNPAADGSYKLTFAIYAADKGGSASWVEGPLDVTVTSGRFVAELGMASPIDAGMLAGLSQQWLGVQVGAEPELPRQRIAAVPFAMAAGAATSLSCTGCVGADQIANGGVAAAKVGFNFAGSSTKGGPASDLECTGCVSVAEMKFDGDVDLGGNALKAGNATFSGDVAAKTVTAQSFLGDGSKLTGIKTPAGSCSKAGEVVKGIAADGSLVCVTPTATVSNDSISTATNGVISNVFNDVFTAPTKGIVIPDNTGASANSDIAIPDLGLARDLKINVKVANSDLAGVSMVLLPPDDKAKGWTLCDPCGEVDAKNLDVTYTLKNPPKSGDMGKWIDANAKGTWTLKVLDASFCIPQKPGNSVLCDLVNKTDGTIVDWSIDIETLSNKKVHDPNGALYARVLTAGDEALADTKAIEVDTKTALPALIAQAWVYDTGKKSWQQAATGVDTVGSCTACGSGKDGDYKPTSSAGLAGKTYEFKDVVIPKGVTIKVTGSTPLYIKATGKVEIFGVLDLSGGDAVDSYPGSNGCAQTACSVAGTAVAGGGAGGYGCYSGAGTTNGTAGSGPGAGGGAIYCGGYGAGGGGGSYGTQGSNGVSGASGCTVGNAGTTYLGVHGGNLQGGSGGGAGSYGTATNAGGAGGGGGGGAVKIDAAEIVVAGSLLANGGRGGHQRNSCDGGAGGGGSGGGIWLRAGKVDLTGGTVSAKGGAAGDAFQPEASDGGDGGAGGDGRIQIDVTAPVIGTTSPTYKAGSSADLGTTLNRFSIEQPTPGLVRLTNTSGKTQNVRLVVTF